MGRKLFVGNLSFDVNNDDLQELFSQAGTCESVAVISDRATGRSRGFAFVEMSSQVEVEKAIRMFNGFNLDNRELKVNLAKPRGARQSGFDQRIWGKRG